MSAFLVSDNHLNYLVSFASDKRATWYRDEKHNEAYGNEQDVFLKLFRANLDSLKARYGDDPAATAPGQFVWRGDCEPVQVLKACACFDYQACEVEDYEHTEAAQIIDSIRDHAIRALKGYESAAWEITEPPATRAIRLSDLCR